MGRHGKRRKGKNKLQKRMGRIKDKKEMGRHGRRKRGEKSCRKEGVEK